MRPAAEHRWSSSRGTPTIQGVVRSRVMYGAPVWADDLMISRRRLLLLRRLHRVTAITIIRGYRTVSHASATVLAAPPHTMGASGAGAQEKMHSNEDTGPGRRLDRVAGPKRPRNCRGGRVRSVTIPADQ